MREGCARPVPTRYAPGPWPSAGGDQSAAQLRRKRRDGEEAARAGLPPSAREWGVSGRERTPLLRGGCSFIGRSRVGVRMHVCLLTRQLYSDEEKKLGDRVWGCPSKGAEVSWGP